jgi:hypothetical protein
MNIKGGALEFDIIANNGQLNSALEESKKRVQGFSDATVEGGEKMELAYQEAAASIEKAFKDIDTMAGIHQGAINKLEKEYTELGEAAAAAFMKGTAKGDEEYRYLQQKQVAIKQEITTRKNLLTEIEAIADALVKEEQRLNETKEATEKNTKAQITFRTQLRNVREELLQMEQSGAKATDPERYRALQAEAGRLAGAISNVNKQTQILGHNQSGLQGVISAVSGISGAFSAAQGAVGLFADKNEDLQKIMVKVQSLMAITIGLQQVAVTLNKDSYFSLVTLAKAQQLLSTSTLFLGKSFIKMGLSANAAKIAVAGLYATLTLGLSLAISGVVYLWNKYSESQVKAAEKTKQLIEIEKEARKTMLTTRIELKAVTDEIKNFNGSADEQKKKVKELNDKYGESFGYYKTLSEWYDVLTKKGEDYIQMLFLQAKAQSLIQKAIEADEKVNEIKATDAKDVKGSMGWFAKMGLYQAQADSYGRFDAQEAITNHNKAAKDKAIKEAEETKKAILTEAEELQKAAAEIQKGFDRMAEATEKGSISSLEKIISNLKEKYKKANTDVERADLLKQIKAKEKELSKVDLSNSPKGVDNKKDKFTKDLEDRKQKYAEYIKWVEAGLQKEAEIEYASLLKNGKTYKEYLQSLLDSGKLTKKEISQVKNEIVGEANTSILDNFKEALSEQINSAKHVIDQLNIIKNMRKELSDNAENDPLTEKKQEIVDKADKNVLEKQREETYKLVYEYSNYLDKKIALELEYTNDKALIEAKRAKATTEEEKKSLDAVIENRKKKYNEDKKNLLYAGYEATRGIIELAEDEALLSISKKVFAWESDRIKAELETQKQAAEKTLEELQKIHREAPTEAIALEIERVKLKIKELNAELEKMPKAKFQEMLSGFQKITSALGNLGGTVGEIFSNISREVDSISESFERGKSETKDYLGGISSAISGVVEVINMVSSASEERKRKEKEFYNAALEFAHEYTLALNEQLRLHSELSDSVFITDYQAKINSGFEAMAESTSKYEEALAKLSEGKAKTGLRNAIDWGNVGSGAAEGAAAGAAIGSIVPVIGTAIGAVVGGAIGAIAGLFGGKKKKETFGGLLEVFPELVDSTGNLKKELAQSLINTNQLDDKTKILVQNALDWAEAVEAANEQIREVVADLAGDLGNNIRNSIVEAWKAGEDASKRMFEVAGESLEKFIEQLVYSTLFSDVFKDFGKELEASLKPDGDGDVIDDVIDDYDRLMDRLNEREDLYVAALEAIRQRAGQRGFDLWRDKNDNTDPTTTLSGAIKGASQESIDLLAGQTNAVRINQVEGIEIMRNQLLHLASIDAKVGVSNGFLKQIEENTRITASDPLRAQGITE